MNIKQCSILFYICPILKMISLNDCKDKQACYVSEMLESHLIFFKPIWYAKNTIWYAGKCVSLQFKNCFSLSIG